MNRKEIFMSGFKSKIGYSFTYKDLAEFEAIIDFYEQQAKKQKEVIDKAMDILKDNFVYDYVRSCDTSDGVGYDEVDTEHFTYKAYEILKEVSE